MCLMLIWMCRMMSYNVPVMKMTFKPNQCVVPGLDPEIVEVQVEEEEDFDDALLSKTILDDRWWGCRITIFIADITRYLKL